MCGYIEDHFKNDLSQALRYYDAALEVLNWGVTFTEDMPEDLRGAIFLETFIRGVQCRRLDTFLAVSSLLSRRLSITELVTLGLLQRQ